MRTSMATVSLGGSLREKLEAIAAAGFDGVEIFETDILAHDGTPAEVGAMVRDLGLEIVALQPFRDFEGMPEPRRSRGFERAKRKFELMNELGTENILVCSNVSPQALAGIDRAAADLRELGELAASFRVNVGFEALAWGRRIWDYRDAWEVVRRANRANVGIILDSFHILSRGLPLDAIGSIPSDRITFVQLADAPKISMDLMQLSRHFRCFPGQGDLDIAGFMQAVRSTGYDGWLSHEIFNDRFRMTSPRRIAADGERSLVQMTGMAHGRPLPATRAPEGVAFLEFAIDEEHAGELSALFRGLGFVQAGQHRSKDVAWWRQGEINLVINTEAEGFAHAHYITHGPSVAAIGLTVGDAARQMDRAEALLAQAYRQHVGPSELEIPAIRGVGGSLIYLLDSGSELGRVWDVEFEPSTSAQGPSAQEAGKLTRIDHIAQTIPFEELPSWRLFYLSIFNLEKTSQVDVADPAGLVESEVMQSSDREVRFALNSSQARQTQSSRFIDEFFGAGVQHVAFATDDIFGAVAGMRAAGVELLPIPENYYDDLEACFEIEPEIAARLREFHILYDEDEQGRYFQVYTRVFAQRFFFEIVAREGYQGFGASNAPIRLAAQARFSRGAAMPRR